MLGERQFYNVRRKSKETVPKQFINVVKFKNGRHALIGQSKETAKFAGIDMYKFISETKLKSLEKKYGKSKLHKSSAKRKSKSPRRKSSRSPARKLKKCTRKRVRNSKTNRCISRSTLAKRPASKGGRRATGRK